LSKLHYRANIIGALSEAYGFAERSKMIFRCDQDTPQPEKNCDIGRKILLMFTLSGFGGAAALSIAEAMIDPTSINGAARPRSSTPHDRSQV
jgi:hypothetical protein